MKHIKELARLRALIDRLDVRVLKLLGRRFALTKKVGRLKTKYNLPARDAKRERSILTRIAQAAKKLGLDPALVKRLYKTIFRAVRK